MDTHVWSFLLVVALFSTIGYYIMKRYAAYHVNKKTQKMIEDFRREEGLKTEDKPVSVVEKELLAKEQAPAKSKSGKDDSVE
jgi:cell division protein FtsL